MVEFALPGEFEAFGHEAFVAEELRGGEVGVDEVPAVEVEVVLEAEAVEKASAADFEAAGEVLEFDEGFFPIGVELMVGIGEEVAVDEGGEPVIEAEVHSEIDALEGEVVVGVVSVSADVFVGGGGGFSEEAVEVEGGEKIDVGVGEGGC